jgi:glycerophosphoryl diester phosphodiesterase
VVAVTRATDEAPFVVAHRAGNELARLRRAEALGVALVEADVHLHAGRLEVRHLKTLGPLPILWDRWTVVSARTPRLPLEALLAAAAPGTELMLDVKGHDRRLCSRLAAALPGQRAGAGPWRLTVCSQAWELLEPLAERLPDARIVHSIGSRRQLTALRRRFAGRRLKGVSIHRKLLDRSVVADLRARADIVMTWPVETPAEARALAAWGVDGVITQSFESIAPALGARVAA